MKIICSADRKNQPITEDNMLLDKHRRVGFSIVWMNVDMVM